MFASIATLLAITVDRYLYIVKPLKYPQIVTHRRVFLAVSGIWLTAGCFFVFLLIFFRSYGIGLQSFCFLPNSIAYFVKAFSIFFPLIIFLLNFHILSVAQKQRKRILAETMIANYVYNSPEKSANRMSFVVGFFSALKATKTFAIHVAVLMFCILIPAVVGPILYKSCSDTVSCAQIWYVVFHYELCGMNSVVNAYIYGIRHVKYRKAYLHILFKLISRHKATNCEF